MVSYSVNASFCLWFSSLTSQEKPRSFSFPEALVGVRWCLISWCSVDTAHAVTARGPHHSQRDTRHARDPLCHARALPRGPVFLSLADQDLVKCWHPSEVPISRSHHWPGSMSLCCIERECSAEGRGPILFPPKHQCSITGYSSMFRKSFLH